MISSPDFEQNNNFVHKSTNFDDFEKQMHFDIEHHSENSELSTIQVHESKENEMGYVPKEKDIKEFQAKLVKVFATSVSNIIKRKQKIVMQDTFITFQNHICTKTSEGSSAVLEIESLCDIPSASPKSNIRKPEQTPSPIEAYKKLYHALSFPKPLSSLIQFPQTKSDSPPSKPPVPTPQIQPQAPEPVPSAPLPHSEATPMPNPSKPPNPPITMFTRPLRHLHRKSLQWAFTNLKQFSISQGVKISETVESSKLDLITDKLKSFERKMTGLGMQMITKLVRKHQQTNLKDSWMAIKQHCEAQQEAPVVIVNDKVSSKPDTPKCE